MKLTLTLDNGPQPGVTDQVLDILGIAGVQAAFFLVGNQLEHPAAPGLVGRMLKEGHTVGNHSLTHSIPLGRLQDPAQAVGEISQTQARLEALGVTTKYFRPFGGGGHINPDLLHPACIDHLAREGYTCVLWNCVPRDWEAPSEWAGRALADLTARPWTVLVIHDKPNGAMDHLCEFILRARALGAEFTAEFPAECTPILQGRMVGDLASIARLNGHAPKPA